MSKDRKTYVALQNGNQVTAYKNKNKWWVGGDKPSGVISILMTKDNRPAWFRLKGCFLKFEDFAPEYE